MTNDLLARLSDAARAELLDRAAEHGGYLLASEVVQLSGSDNVANVMEQLGDEHDIVLVDDLAGDREEAVVATGLSGDPVRQYLNEAGRYALLDFEREQDLAKRFQAGLAARRLLERGEVTDATRRRLAGIVRDGERAKEQLVRCNLRLVVPTARRYAGADLPMIEAIQEGNLGLIRAVEKFDHTKGYKFSTYAVWWIRQAVQRGLAKRGRTIRVPTTVWEHAGKVRRAESQLRTKLGRDPEDPEIAAETGLSVERINEVRDALRPLTSLDRPVGEDGDASFGDLLHDPESVDPSDDSVATDVRNRLTAALATLPDRERRIIELRFGLGDEAPCTLEQVGTHVGLTRERVRQLEKEALAKLRTVATAEGLQDALGVLAA